VRSAENVPLASRIAQLSEYVEVAYRVGGVPAHRRSDEAQQD